MPKYYGLELYEIWLDAEGCKWYIYSCFPTLTSGTYYEAKCIEGIHIGVFKTYTKDGKKVGKSTKEETLIKQVDN